MAAARKNWYPCARCGGGRPMREIACRVSAPDDVCEPCLRIDRAYARLQKINAQIIHAIRGK